MVLRNLGRLALGLCCAVALAACAGSRGGSIPYSTGTFAAPDAPTAVVADEGYKLAPLDTVTVNVYQIPDLSKDYVIDMSGRITMPLIGSVSAVGLSTNELGAQIQAKLGEKYLQNPNVTIALKESTSRVVTVDGSVQRPGIFPATRPLTLMQTVAMAQGTSDSANPHRVAIFRQVGGKRMAAAFDLVRIRRGEESDPVVYAGDTVIVDGSKLRQAQRDILATVPLLPIFMAL